MVLNEQKKPRFKRTNRGESVEHRLLKQISSKNLEANGYRVKKEQRIGNSVVDVLAQDDARVTIVEYEAFRKYQKKNLQTRYREALLSFPNVPNLKRILCIPHVIDIEEIWVADVNSGILRRYSPLKRSGDESHF